MEELLISMLPQLLGAGGGGGMGGGGGANAMGGLLGVSQLISGLSDKRRAGMNKPPLEDNEQRNFLNELNQKRKAIRTGSAYSEDLRQLRSQQAGTDAGILSASGGAGGAAIAGLARAQRGTGAAYGGILANAEKRADDFDSMYEGMLDKVAGRKLDLQTFEYNRALADAAKNKQAGQQNLLASNARSMPLDFNNLLPKRNQTVVAPGTEAYPDMNSVPDYSATA